MNDEEREKYGNNFALSQGVFSDFALEKMGADEFLSHLSLSSYEGFFETQKEAFMQVKLVEMMSKIQRMEYAFADFSKVVENLKTPEWL